MIDNTLTIQAVMTPDPKCVPHDQPLWELKKTMEDFGIRHLPVLMGNRFMGVISQRDVTLAKTLENANTEFTAGEICELESYTVAPDELLSNVVTQMATQGIGSAVILDKGDVVGIYTTVDACKQLGDVLRSSAVTD